MSSILQSRRRRREALTGWAFAAPAAAVIIVLFLIPLVLAAWMSLNDWPLIGEPSFNAPDNFVAMTQNKLFTGAIAFTVKYTVVVVLIYLIGGLALALLVQNRRRGVGIFRTAYLMPAAVGLASSSLLFYALYNIDYSPLDDILRALRLVQGNPEFLGTPDKAFASTVVLVAWRFVGFTMIILLTGLQAIPLDVYEAARVDGAGWWKVLWHITLPLLRPTILLVLVLNVTGSLLAFEPFYVVTAGGPNNSTVTMVMAMFREAFTLYRLGTAAAIAMTLLVVLVLINILQLTLLKERD